MKNKLLGTEMDMMPDFVFRMMKILFVVFYFFRPPGKYIKKFGIKPGSTVVDYGCGPGAFIREASKATGDNGMVYAIDIHKIAIESVGKIVAKYSLKNVSPVLAEGNNSGLPDDTADLVYALDMFHMVSDPGSFLKELNRITKAGGTLIIEDGHQPRSLSREKILQSGFWTISGEEKRFLRCAPVRQ